MEIIGLDWDEENVGHIRAHDVHPYEVREVLQSAPVILRAESEGKNPVYVAIGFTSAGRLVEVWGIHFQEPPLKDWWRTITAMDARKQQKDRYFSERRS